MSKLRLINVKSAINSLDSDKISTSMLKSDLSSLEFANIKSPSTSHSTSKLGVAPTEYTHLSNKLQATQNTVSEHVQLSEYLLKSIPNCLDFNTENRLLGDLFKAPFNFEDCEQVLIQSIDELPIDKPLVLKLAFRVISNDTQKVVPTNYRDFSGNLVGFITIFGNSKNDLIDKISFALEGPNPLNLKEIIQQENGIDTYYLMPVILKYD